MLVRRRTQGLNNNMTSVDGKAFAAFHVYLNKDVKIAGAWDTPLLSNSLLGK